MENQFQWKPGYETGVEEIDAQHKQLLKLIEKTFHLRNENADCTEVKDLLDDLIRYAFYHFRSEEMIWELYGYPGIDDQRSAHKEISKDLEEIVCQIQSGAKHIPELVMFLFKWFVDHTTMLDREGGDHILSQRA